MTHYPTSPLIRFLGDGERAVLEEDYYFVCSVGKKNYQCIIKKGLIFDGASIPRFCWRIIGHPWMMPMLACALPHDILYASEAFKQSDCDWIFICLQQYVGINWFKRNIVWSAVRSFGWLVWRKHTKKSIDDAKSYLLIVEVEDNGKSNS